MLLVFYITFKIIEPIYKDYRLVKYMMDYFISNNLSLVELKIIISNDNKMSLSKKKSYLNLFTKYVKAKSRFYNNL